MKAWLKLIRWNNLFIIFLTQLLVWACVILPLRSVADTSLLLYPTNFFLLAASTVLIAAAGYIINDYFDIKIDIINRPEKVILEKRIPLKMAIILHSVFNITGISFAAILAREAGHYSWLTIQIGCTVLLWFYSTHFKRQFMSGNIIVALLTAFTITVLLLYEPALHTYFTAPPFTNTRIGIIPNPVWVLGVYAYFAFILTWMREIVKDMEDFKGDAEEGCVTMPIKWGLLKSVRFTQLLGLFAIIPLLKAGYELCASGWWGLGIYTLAGIVLPLIVWLWYVQTKSTSKHYHLASRYIKIIMLLGILSLVIYYFEAYG